MYFPRTFKERPGCNKLRLLICSWNYSADVFKSAKNIFISFCFVPVVKLFRIIESLEVATTAVKTEREGWTAIEDSWVKELKKGAKEFIYIIESYVRFVWFSFWQLQYLSFYFPFLFIFHISLINVCTLYLNCFYLYWLRNKNRLGTHFWNEHVGNL